MRPALTTTTRSATSSASSWSCVTNTLVTWSSSCKRRSQRRRSLRTLASSAPNGSSSSRTRRLDRERSRQRDALALPARKLIRIAVAHPVELDQLEQLVHPLPDFLRRPAAPTEAGRAARRQRCRTPSCAGTARSAGRRTRRCVSARRASVASSPCNRTVPVSGSVQPGDDAQQRRLAAPRRAEQRDSSPVSISSDRSFSARKLPNCLLTCRIWMLTMVSLIFTRRPAPGSLWHRPGPMSSPPIRLNPRPPRTFGRRDSASFSHSTNAFSASVTNARSASSDATANAAAN